MIRPLGLCAVLLAAAPAHAGVPADGSDCDAERGRVLYSKCVMCHTLEEGGAHLDGPVLYGILGRRIAAAEGFAYSEALEALRDGSWSGERLDRFLADPQFEVPGTTMAFAGLRKAQDRRDLLCYLAAPAGQ